MRKAGPPREIPPPLELECLKVLWLLGEGNVKEVRKALAESRPLAYTTIMTVLDRLVRKGGVSRRKVGRSFVYVPVLTRESLRRIAVRELVHCFFGGSDQALLQYLQNRSGEKIIAGFEERSEDARLETALL
jgi:predicted transcriptional regulator